MLTLKAVALLIFAFIAVSLGAFKSPRNFDGYSFKDYIAEFGKNYKDSEFHHRRAIFEMNMELIRKHNAGNFTWFMGVTPFTDMTDSEHAKFRGYHTMAGYRRFKSSPILLTQPEIKASDLPKSVDWRKKDVVTPVKDQGSCGSCWAFSAAETIESHLAISTGTLKVLSEEELVSCAPAIDPTFESGGCDGATVELAYDYVIRNGLTDENDLPYTSYQGDSGVCPKNISLRRTVEISGYNILPPNKYLPLMHAVATKGPIAISVDASNWSKYKGGIFDGCDHARPTINHAVQLVGYGEEDGIPYWLIRNSWDTTWGEDGYIRIRRYTDFIPCGEDGNRFNYVTICGNCGILFDNVYPTGVRLAYSDSS